MKNERLIMMIRQWLGINSFSIFPPRKSNQSKSTPEWNSSLDSCLRISDVTFSKLASFQNNHEVDELLLSNHSLIQTNKYVIIAL